MFLTVDFDFKPLRKKLPSLMSKRINKDVKFVKKKIDEGIDKGVSPITGEPFKPISEVTKYVRKARRKNTKSDDKPLFGTGQMTKLKVKKSSKTKLSASLTMGREYGAYHLTPYIITNNFSLKRKGQKRVVGRRASGGRRIKTTGKTKEFIKAKGKKVPARVWFGIPQDYIEETSFNWFLDEMKISLKQGKPIIRQKIGNLRLS